MVNKKYKKSVSKDKLLFEITEGQFKGVQFTFNTLSLNGHISYNIKNKKKVITEDSKYLFENMIRDILSDVLSKVSQ